VAWHLRQLRDAGVPVLWRPYHEMNGAWFWWGQKRGDDGYRKLYRMLFARLVRFHHLNNLIWIYGANEIREGVDGYEPYYPGPDVVDVLATDVYQGAFAKDYGALQALAGEKPDRPCRGGPGAAAGDPGERAALGLVHDVGGAHGNRQHLGRHAEDPRGLRERPRPDMGQAALGQGQEAGDPLPGAKISGLWARHSPGPAPASRRS
jgi:hypothetical protein